MANTLPNAGTHRRKVTYVCGTCGNAIIESKVVEFSDTDDFNAKIMRGAPLAVVAHRIAGHEVTVGWSMEDSADE